MDGNYITYVYDEHARNHDYDDTDHGIDGDTDDDTDDDTKYNTEDDTDNGGRGNRRPLPGGAVQTGRMSTVFYGFPSVHMLFPVFAACFHCGPYSK